MAPAAEELKKVPSPFGHFVPLSRYATAGSRKRDSAWRIHIWSEFSTEPSKRHSQLTSSCLSPLGVGHNSAYRPTLQPFLGQ